MVPNCGAFTSFFQCQPIFTAIKPNDINSLIVEMWSRVSKFELIVFSEKKLPINHFFLTTILRHTTLLPYKESQVAWLLQSFIDPVGRASSSVIIATLQEVHDSEKILRKWLDYQ